MAKRVAVTNKIELVETQNLTLSIARLRSTPYDGLRWRRALYHALMMELSDADMLKTIRGALRLP